MFVNSGEPADVLNASARPLELVASADSDARYCWKGERYGIPLSVAQIGTATNQRIECFDSGGKFDVVVIGFISLDCLRSDEDHRATFGRFQSI